MLRSHCARFLTVIFKQNWNRTLNPHFSLARLNTQNAKRFVFDDSRFLCIPQLLTCPATPRYPGTFLNPPQDKRPPSSIRRLFKELQKRNSAVCTKFHCRSTERYGDIKLRNINLTHSIYMRYVKLKTPKCDRDILSQQCKN